MSFEAESGQAHVQGLFAESSTKKHRYGARIALDDGRVFRYAEIGGTAIAVASIVQGPVLVANHTNIAVAAAAAVDAKSVQLTLGATATTKNQYAEGYLNINDAAGEGHLYKISGHAAAASSGTQTVDLYDPIRVALTTSSEGSLVKHPYKDVIIHPSPPTAVVVGCTPIAFTADYFGWLQTWGPASVLIDGTPAVNVRVIPSSSVDGSVATGVETDVIPQCGIMLDGSGVDTEERMVFLTVSP